MHNHMAIVFEHTPQPVRSVLLPAAGPVAGHLRGQADLPEVGPVGGGGTVKLSQIADDGPDVVAPPTAFGRGKRSLPT